MKKTLFIAALAASAISYADTYDALRPQAIIDVAAGETLANTDESFTIDLTQKNTGTTTSDRTAIVKDGQGTFVVNSNVDMQCPLVVREGTMQIQNATVTNNPYIESPNLGAVPDFMI